MKFFSIEVLPALYGMVCPNGLVFLGRGQVDGVQEPQPVNAEQLQPTSERYKEHPVSRSHEEDGDSELRWNVETADEGR